MPERLHEIHQKTHSTRKFCDPFFSNAGGNQCSSGFYRETVGPHRGQCVPCDCNGLSDQCDEQTGDCVNCQSNTSGGRCERCKDGFYGNAANRTCRECPCPFPWKSFALACLDIGSGVVECLCKRGYSGARCERCSFGYYGNPEVPGSSCRPCNCTDGGLNVCDSLTGECTTSGDSSCGDHCHECDSCPEHLLLDLENMDDDLAQLKQQLQNISNSPNSFSRLKHLQDNMTETKTLVPRFTSALRHLDSKAGRLEEDEGVDGEDLSHLSEETLKTVSDVEKVLQNVNGTKLMVEAFFSETAVLLTAITDLINQQQTEVKSRDLPEDRVAMMEGAERMVQRLKGRSCGAHRDGTDGEQLQAHTLLDLIRSNMSHPVAVLNQAADALKASDSSLREITELLSDAEGRMNRTKGLNVKGYTLLQHLEHFHAHVQEDESALRPVVDTTQDLLMNVTDIFLMLEEIKKDFENHSAQMDGAKLELFRKLNKIHILGKVDVMTKAEKHAMELSQEAAEIQQMLRDATNSTDLLRVMQTGAYNSIINAVEKAEMEAHQTQSSTDRAVQDMMEGGLNNRAAALRDNSSHQLKEAMKTQIERNMLWNTETSQQDVNQKKEKGKSLRTSILTVDNNLRNIRRDDTAVLIESAKSAASASSSTVSNMTERLKRVSQEVDRITLTNISVNIDKMLTDANLTVKNLITALPVLKDKTTEVEAFSGKAPPIGNITENIRRIKELIEETRNFVNRLPVATTFNGKSHVELHAPKNLEDIRAFTAVDLLLNLHPNHPSNADKRRRRRQDKHRDHSFFVFYLGSQNGSGDYIGMAIQNKVLVCVYQLGGVVHEVETNQITETTNEKLEFDRVLFHRVYQDAEVNITQKIMSQKPLIVSPKRHRPNTTTRVLQLDPNGVVFYVGGYPQNFKPPVELHYPKFRGAIKLSYINGFAVSLFNYKHAVNLEAKQTAVKIPQTEVSDYYEGTGYRLAFIKEPDKIKKRLFRFHTNSRETNALIFYIGNQDSFFCLSVERGFLVLQGQQAGREIRVQSDQKVSLFDLSLAITIGTKFIVHFGLKKISTDHTQTNYRSYYIGGLSDQLRQRNNITAPPLRGCVDQLSADAQIIEYDQTIGVSNGCPAALLGVHAATLYSALSADSLFDWDKLPLTVSVSFWTTDTHGSLLRSSSQGSTSVHDLQLSLDNGYIVFSSDNYTLRSDKMYNDGKWHYLSAVRRTNGLELIMDNIKVIQRQMTHDREEDQTLKIGKFKSCIANLYTQRPEKSFIPADLSLLSLSKDVVLGWCDLHLPPHNQILPDHIFKRLQNHKPTPVPAGSRCRSPSAPWAEYQLLDDHSWLSYTLPQQDLNYRPHFSFNIKTKSYKGLILHVAGRGVVPLLALYVANGKVKMSLGHDRIIQHNKKSNDGDWHRVDFSVERRSFHLLVDGVRVTDGLLPNNEGSSLDLMNPVYLGGDPTGRATKGHSIPTNSVIGCVQDFKMNEEAVGEPEGRHRTLPCPDMLTETGTYFGGGHIVKDHFFTLSSQFVLSFELRPEHLTGLLFHVSSHKSSFDVFLIENKVGVSLKAGMNTVSLSVTPPQSLCDGNFHLVTVSRQHEVVQLEVDSWSEQKKVPFASTWSSTKPESLYIGGTTTKHKLLVPSPFFGCLRNVKLNGLCVSFENRSRSVHPVTIRGCPAE
ncbi:laminin subunit alpha-3 isoform X1 [Labrus mixtus]|uniref:laminin subunit alpha-3 isoform X1 n=2 Tax=Labrus mixtus TaxID=508554 RepID=UPI0029BFC547|nr:laminin subunit alpha-3 isoform X1 [Labrus mixtus]